MLRREGALHAGDGSPRSDAGDQGVDLTVRVFPDLHGRGVRVHFGVRGVVELLRHEGVRNALADFVGLVDGAGHALRGVRQHQLRAQNAQHGPSFGTHGLGHGEDALIALYRRHKRQRDAGVAARGLDDHRLAGLQLSRALGGDDHRQPDPILHAVPGIVALQLRDDLRLDARRNAVQSNEGRAADEFGHVCCDVHECDPP
jgi:hypothetical protein